MNPLDNIAAFANQLEVLYGRGMLFIFWLIFAFLFLAVVFLIMTLLSRIAKDKDNRFLTDLSQFYEERMLVLLYESDAQFQEPLVKQIQEKLKTRFQKQALTDMMVRLGKGLNGTLSSRLQDLFRLLGLHLYSIEKLKAANWSIQSSGISELREMHIVESVPAIRKLINHKNTLVRSHAQLALLELESDQDRLSVFEQITNPISTWDQLRLHESLKSRNGDKIESFARLFHLPNKTVSLFAIRMSAYFGCSRDIPMLQELTHHEDAEIRKEAILALTRLGDYLMQEALASQFDTENDEIKSAILEYLSYTGFDNLSFYEHALIQSNHSVSLSAAQALAYLRPPGFPLKFEEDYAGMPEVVERLKHAADRRLLSV